MDCAFDKFIAVDILKIKCLIITYIVICVYKIDFYLFFTSMPLNITIISSITSKPVSPTIKIFFSFYIILKYFLM